jgi:hypothetical protein
VVNSDHVFVFLSNNPNDPQFAKRTDLVKSNPTVNGTTPLLSWVNGESGQGAQGFATDANLKMRQVKLTGRERSSTPIEDSKDRVISGWLSLAQFDYDPRVLAQMNGS